MELNINSLGIGARVSHPSFGEGIVIGMDTSTMHVFFQGEGEKEISRSFEGLEVLESPRDYDDSIQIDSLKTTLRKVLSEFENIQHPVDLGAKWEGGSLVLNPGKEGLQSKEIPIDAFFHKIVMVRDRLRVLEQNINSHKVLTDIEKVNLQQYISRIYGSLTTFNILFDDKANHFSSKG
jgi:hypothetical protein